MPVVTVSEIVRLAPLRMVDHPPWTLQPDGTDLYVGDLMEPSSECAGSISVAQREVMEFEQSTPRIEARALRPYQEECIKAVFAAWAAGKKAPLVVLATGCHRAGQLVIMFDGTTKRVEDVDVGDLLLGPDSQPRRVLNLCRGESPMYEVRPKKGPSWVVNGDHVLSLMKTGEGAKDRARASRGICTTEPVDVTVAEWLSWGKTQKHVHKIYRSEAVDFAPNNDTLVLEPYFLGMLLGDGTLSKACVEVSKPDEEIRLECAKQAQAHGLTLKKGMGGGEHPSPTWKLVAEMGHRNPLLDKLRQLNLCPVASHERAVPPQYLRASKSVRTDLLAGLLDTDGSRTRTGYEFSSKSRQLAEDVVFIARSLGFHSSGAVQMEKSAQTGVVGTYWRVLLGGDMSHMPIRIPRKMVSPRRQKKHHLRHGFNIVPTGTVESFYGFTLDGDHRYLLDDFTVTHNSGKTVIASEIVRRLRNEHHGFGYRIWFVAHRNKLLKQAYRTMKLIAPEATCGLVQGPKNDVGKFVTVGSVDTLVSQKRFDDATSGHNSSARSLVAKPPSLVIIDECHRSTSPKYRLLIQRIKAANPTCVFLGLTATPGRTDGTALDEVFDHIAYERNAFQLIEDGYLVPPVGFRVDLNVNLDVIATDVEGQFKKAPLSKVLNQPDVNQAVVEGYQRYGDARKLIAFCVDVAHARDLAETFRANGIAARHVDGTMKEADQEATLQAFSEGKMRILASCDLLTEGYDDPSAQGVLFARPTNSQLVYVQALGRGLRLHPSKRDALVIDCVGNSQKHKLVQLASLAGLDNLLGGDRPAKPGFMPTPEIGIAEVGAIEGHSIDFRVMRQRASRWSWRETRFGWTVNIPRVGYFLLGWAANDRLTVDVKFHDMRDGKRDSLPLILASKLDFDMAYSLVEGEIDRLFSARTSKARAKENGKMGAARDAMEEGLTGELFSPEELMRTDADWRDKVTSERQRAALIEIGVKEASVPSTAGEASDLLSVMTIERNAKMREPATDKQKSMISQQKLATYEELQVMTKKQAQSLIVRFLKEKEAKRRAESGAVGADDEIPFPTDDDR